jgi:predicted MPP superfamily phosphohydrolase
MLIFLSSLTVVLGSVHVYLWRRLVSDTRIHGIARPLSTVLIAFLAVSVPLTFMIWTAFSRDAGSLLGRVAFTWLGAMFYVLLVLVCWDAVRLVVWLARAKRVAPEPGAAPSLSAASGGPREAIERETRRVFLARSAATTALVAASGVSALGVRAALWDITTPQVSVGLSRFPRALDGYSIALLSDVHIGPTLDGRFLRGLVEQTNRMRPDLIAIAGDLVDGSVAYLGSQVAELARLRARHGIYFVTGNHEYYSGAMEWVGFLRSLGVQVLMNQRVRIGDSQPDGASFDLAGVPDRMAPARLLRPDPAAAVVGRDPERELVMLAHQPAQIDASVAVGVGLQLSGHTHGGQLYPFGALTRLIQPYLAGLHHHPNTGTQIYVSRGTGFWGPPMRVLAPAEITTLHLHSV